MVVLYHGMGMTSNSDSKIIGICIREMVTVCQYMTRVFSPFAFPHNKVHGANMGPISGRQDPGGPQVGPMNFANWVDTRPYHGSSCRLECY